MAFKNWNIRLNDICNFSNYVVEKISVYVTTVATSSQTTDIVKKGWTGACLSKS